MAGTKEEKRKRRESLVAPVQTPWLNGIPEAASYARIRESEMRRFVKAGLILSRKKPKYENGKRPPTILVYAPSIDAFLMKQPPATAPMAEALSALA